MSTRPKLVVVGNGMAGAKTLEHLLEAAPGRYEITVFGSEPHPNYNRILLSPVLAGEMSLSDIVINDAAWYRRHGITLCLGKTVTTIDRRHRIVRTADGATAAHDRVLLATGSTPVRLPLEGADLEGVLTYRDIADTDAMIAASRNAGATASKHTHGRTRRAVVIGGGLLGLEAANGLQRRGMAVTVLHVMPWLMERQLDRTAAETLQSALEARGVAFRLSAATRAIEGRNGKVAAVVLKDGGRIETDLVVMAVGIRPNVWLAESCGLRVDRGIVVDDTLQTFDPRIYAVGECVAHRGVGYGLVAPLYEMARVCASHLAAVGTQYYIGSVPATRLKVTGVDVFSAGDFSGSARSQALTLCHPAGGVYRKLVIEDDVLVGSVLVGDTSAASQYAALIAGRQNVAAIRDQLMFMV